MLLQSKQKTKQEFSPLKGSSPKAFYAKFKATISTAVVLVSRADVSQAEDFFVSAKLIDSQASNDVFKVPLSIA